ncbi:STAS domain-containing protein [Mycobacterium sp. AMU20-3851]|uniref:STAS domain-containing protein n=1 Tax=Mycobacterium sp. AMU20-3851 TaxID=3122055 RepID=UPI0037543B65
MTDTIASGTHSRPTPLEMATEWRDIDLAVITVAGDIDAANTRVLLDYTLGKLLLCRRMILDLTAVSFFATDGYWALKTLESRCVLADTEFTLLPGTQAGRALQVCERADQHAL